MIHLHFVGDGERDAATIPRLIEKLVGREVRVAPSAWSSLRVGGYARKLQFASRVAQDANAQGLIAIIDSDRDHRSERLKELRAGRAADRAKRAPFPTAVGEAKPHGEAWLLDDPQAVRAALRLPSETAVNTVRQTKSPKSHLERLWRASERSDERALDLWEEIARGVEPKRFQHAGETGFDAFAQEVRHEMDQLAR